MSRLIMLGTIAMAFVHGAASGADAPSFSNRETAGPWAAWADSRVPPCRMLFELDFDSGFTAQTATGESIATNSQNRPELVDGVSGKAARFGEGQWLRFAARGHIDKTRGALAMWIQPAVDGVGESGRRYFLFHEEGAGLRSNAMALFLDGDWEMRFHPYANSDYLHIPQAREWRKDEWRHLIVNWDAEQGVCFAYLDGEPASWAMGPCLSWSYAQTPWQPQDHEAFFIGAQASRGANPWLGAIDEARIFDRPLSPAEARAEFERFCRRGVFIDALDRYPYAGQAETIRLAFENPTAARVRLLPHIEILDASGDSVFARDLAPIEIASGKSARAAFESTFPRPGAYSLTVSFEHEGRIERRVFDVRCLAMQESAQAAERLVEVARIDAVRPAAIAESAPSKIVDSPLGQYREAGAEQHARFALAFEVAEIGEPHLAVVAYPDDKPRTMEIVLQNLDGIEDRQMQVGFSTGEEFALSGGMIEQRLLFWPKSPRYALIFMTAEEGHPAAVRDVAVYRLESGLPAAPVASFRGSVPARRIGMYYEDPVIPKNYGDTAHFPGFASTIDRMLDYMDWFGQDTLTYPVVWYRGPIYKSSVEPFSPVSGVRPHPHDYPAYLMRRLAARGMAFLPVFALHEIPSLTPLAITDMKRVAAGEETTISVRCDDTLSLRGRHNSDSDFNPLDPRIQARVKDLVAEFLDLYGDEPALDGLMLLMARHKIYQFGSAESGYNDINLRRFQEETGIRIPVDSSDPKRFSLSGAWLKANAWEPWIDWRCRKVHDYCKEIADMLTRRRPDLNLVLGLLPRLESKAEARYLPEGEFLGRIAREAGIDTRMFENDANIQFEYLPRAGSLRWMRASGKNELAQDSRTMELAPEIVAAIEHSPGASYVIYDRYWENAVGENAPLDLSPLGSESVREIPWRVTAFNPNSFHCLENYAAALNNLDAVRITKGGFVVGTLGIEAHVARFAQAFRALPAVRFNDIEGLEDPVRVRQAIVDGTNYFYALNRLPLEVEMELSIEPPAATVDLASGTSAAETGCLALTLRPYDLRAFRAAGPSSVAGGSARIPDGFLAELTGRLAEAAQRAAGEPPGSDALVYLARARELLEQGQYARAYFMLQEDWATERSAPSRMQSKAQKERAKKK